MSFAVPPSEIAVGHHLLYHYGTPEQIHPQHPEARELGRLIVDGVTEPMRHIELKNHRRALDLGCATGRSTFEWRRFFDEVIGLDLSPAFISAAQHMQREGCATASVERNPGAPEEIQLRLPAHLSIDHVHFREGDACSLEAGLGRFDLVAMAQLIDRVVDPERCLRQMEAFLAPGGWFVLTSSFNWSENFTPREKWLGGGRRSLVETCRDILGPSFVFHRRFHLPYLVRSRASWFEWSVAEVSIWRRGETLAG